jgi:hypothetical protein
MFPWALVSNLPWNGCYAIHGVRLLKGSVMYSDLGTDEDCWVSSYSDSFFGVLIGYPALFVVAKPLGSSPFQECIRVLIREPLPGY